MIRLLAILLVVQLGILAYLYRPQSAPVESPASLIDAPDRSLIDRVEISAGEGTAVTLSREEEKWRLPSGLPVEQRKLDALLDAVISQEPGVAIATSPAAATRFSVSPAKLERRINVAQGKTEQIVFLGTAPAFRKIYARRDGDSAIYVIDFNSFDAPTTESEWLDPTLLARRSVESVSLYGATLSLSEDGLWISDDGRAVDMSAMETLVQAMAGLRVNGMAEPGDQGLGEATESLRVAISDEDGAAELVVLRSQTSDDEPEQFFLQDSRYDISFSTSAYDAERLVEAVASIFADEVPGTLPTEDSRMEAP